MAHTEKRGKKWRVCVKLNGVRSSATFNTKAQADAWATVQEAEILSGQRGEIPNKTVADLFERYISDVSIKKSGSRWEKIRLKSLLRDDLSKVKLKMLNNSHISAWRDSRINEVSGATVIREMNLLSAVFNRAIKEWKWLKENPCRGVERPPKPRPRTRRISDNEVESIILALGCSREAIPKTITARVGHAFLFALETAMRAGEICGLKWVNVDLEKRVARLLMTKNGESRDVPLSKAATNILQNLPRDTDTCFGLSGSQIDALFRKAKKRALIEGMTFHDSRAEALTRLSKKVDVLTLARISGHKDLRILMEVYYRETASEIAARLD